MHVEPRNFGDLVGSLYSFDEPGDKLPMHTHTEENVHVTFVLTGSFRIWGDGWEITAEAGRFIDWKPGQAHEFVALTPGARILNVVKTVTAV